MTAMNPQQRTDPATDARTRPLDTVDVSDPRLYQSDTWHPYFERLRREAPVHYCAGSGYGPYWSITRYKDIADCALNHAAFSSETGNGFSVQDIPADQEQRGLIRMDPPKHTEQRKTVSPMIAPKNLANLEPLIRQRTQMVLDGLPRNETFNWVTHVSINLTTMMLLDLLSMLAHSNATRDMPVHEFMGNLRLLIVGGNDTTRNSMSGGLLALNEFPDEYRKLMANPALVDSMIPEMLRYVSPVIHFRRTTTQDIDVAGQRIPAESKVVLWYISGNRDEKMIEQPNRLIIDRAKPRQHLAYGFGIHRCVGDWLAELQLRILWEEILQRFPMIEVMGEPVRSYSNFLRGIRSLPVRIPA